MAITVALVAGFLVPVAMSVACVVIARHLFPAGERFWAGLGGAAASIGLPVLVILGIRSWTGMHERLSGALGPFVSVVLFAAASLLGPGALLWISRTRGR